MRAPAGGSARTHTRAAARASASRSPRCCRPPRCAGSPAPDRSPPCGVPSSTKRSTSRASVSSRKLAEPIDSNCARASRSSSFAFVVAARPALRRDRGCSSPRRLRARRPRAPRAQHDREQLLRLRELPLVGEDLRLVVRGAHGAHVVARAPRQVAAAAVEVECVVPTSCVIRGDAEVVQHAGLSDEIAELLVERLRELAVFRHGTPEVRVRDVEQVVARARARLSGPWSRSARRRRCSSGSTPRTAPAGIASPRSRARASRAPGRRPIPSDSISAMPSSYVAIASS